jgi:hypothetical protein
MYNSTHEYMQIRGILEEHNANIFVEDLLITTEQRAVWLLFDSTSDIAKIPSQILQAAKDFNLSIIIFKIGKSYPLVYVRVFKGFYGIKAIPFITAIPSELPRYVISPDRILSALKSMVIEDKRRRICYANGKAAQSKANHTHHKKLNT